MNKNLIRHQTVILIGKILHPLTESNLILETSILTNLNQNNEMS